MENEDIKNALKEALNIIDKKIDYYKRTDIIITSFERMDQNFYNCLYYEISDIINRL